VQKVSPPPYGENFGGDRGEEEEKDGQRVCANIGEPIFLREKPAKRSYGGKKINKRI